MRVEYMLAERTARYEKGSRSTSGLGDRRLGYSGDDTYARGGGGIPSADKRCFAWYDGRYDHLRRLGPYASGVGGRSAERRVCGRSGCY